MNFGLTKKGRFFVIAAPSGAGKTSLVRALLKEMPRLALSISYTTRPPRPNDKQGHDYFFVSKQQFEEMIAQKAFLEYANVYGHYYGTPRAWVEDKLASAYDVILEIDWQGARQICQSFMNVYSIFILPPSIDELAQRLVNRKEDSAATIEERLKSADSDMAHCCEFNYCVVNDNFEQALQDIQGIIKAVRHRVPADCRSYKDLLAQWSQSL